MNEKRFKTAFQVVDRRTGVVAEELPLLSVSQYRGVVPRSELKGDEGRAADLSNYKVCDPGDIVLNRMSAYNGAVGLANLRGVVSPDYLVMRPNVGYDGRYLTYLIKSAWFVSEMSRRVKGIGSIDSGAVRTPRIGAAELGDIRVRLPCLNQQQIVVDFLDRETAQIDAFIAKNEELIALLTERRAAAIEGRLFSAPTGALLTIRRVLEVAQTGPFGTQLSASEYVSDGVPVINPTHIVKGLIQPDTEVSVPPSRAETMTRFRLRTGDIVLGRKGEVDKSAIVTPAFDGAICGSDSMMLRPNGRVTSEYLWTFLQSSSAHSQLERFSVGSTVAGLNQQTLRSVRLPVPEADEQVAVVQTLKLLTGRVDQAILTAARSIDLARERRAALISAAVTGKIDVGVSA